MKSKAINIHCVITILEVLFPSKASDADHHYDTEITYFLKKSQNANL